MSMAQRQGSQRTAEFFPENPLGEHARGTRGQIEHRVTEAPMSAVLITFGVGFGLGAIAGSIISRAGHLRREEPEGIAATLGRRVLESLSEVLPEGWRSRGLWS